ncbi:hypothetical protein [Nonomuraea rubra]|uniref:hypothetical protein n=1 Tax=Nonomuraea rubra TaxID=46180 RepID=UPI0034094E90
MAGTAGSIRVGGSGFAALAVSFVDLQPTPSGTWVNTGLQLVLPAAGTYHLDATVRSSMTAASPVNTWVAARLFDVTAGAAVPDSEAIVQQISMNASAGVVNHGYNNTAPIQVQYAVTGARTIRLEAMRVNASGASATARIHSDGNGRTTLRFARMA